MGEDGCWMRTVTQTMQFKLRPGEGLGMKKRTRREPIQGSKWKQGLELNRTYRGNYTKAGSEGREPRKRGGKRCKGGNKYKDRRYQARKRHKGGNDDREWKGFGGKRQKGSNLGKGQGMKRTRRWNYKRAEIRARDGGRRGPSETSRAEIRGRDRGRRGPSETSQGRKSGEGIGDEED